MYPSRFPKAALDRHTGSLAQEMERADLSVVQIIDFDSFPDTALWSTYLKRPQIDGLIYLEYSRYDSHKGKVVWANGKPVISARTMLWDGLPGADEASVIAELNSATRDPHSTALLLGRSLARLEQVPRQRDDRRRRPGPARESGPARHPGQDGQPPRESSGLTHNRLGWAVD